MGPSLPDLVTVSGALASHLARVEADLACQQAVRGLDALDELDLHPVIAAGLEAVGCGVLREVRYPGPVGRRARRSERERCDLVLTPGPGQRLADPVEALREQDRMEGTLFAQIGAGPDEGVAPQDALWLEVKTLGQFAFRDGTPGPNPSYASELVGGPARDIGKLARDGRIESAAVVIVLFCADEAVARHDIAAAAMRWLDKDLPFAEPLLDGLPIQDRIGNGWCAVALVRVRAPG
ncbi:MAG: hypothetical protein ACF8R7_17710 [Phycisphaerales bacterium JB039]